MTPFEAYINIRKACLERPELKYRDPSVYNQEIDEGYFKNNKYKGFCYVASLAFCHLIPEATLYHLDNRGHFFNMIGNQVWDLTAEQFSEVRDYTVGTKVRRRKLTKRAQQLVDQIML